MKRDGIHRNPGTASFTLSIAAICFAIMFTNVLLAKEAEPTPLGMDNSLRSALEKTDKSSAAAFLDSEFTWTDAAGKTRSKEETLSDFSGFAADNAGYPDVGINSYERLAITYGAKADGQLVESRFVRIWVKRSNNWRLFADLDTPVTTGERKIPSQSTGDCVNPCRVLPYHPQSEAESALLSMWQKAKVDEWHPDIADWSTHVADEFMMVNNGTAQNKAQRVAFGAKLQAAGISMPGDPILEMGLKQFGDAMVMISRHSPYRGGKPYYNLRVFVLRDGQWLAAWSQQTTIQAAAAVSGVEGKHD
jgi:hypothetical protein